MKNQIFLFVTIVVVVLFSGCKKEKHSNSPESIFYGTWVRPPVDTIYFYNSNGINILKTKQSQPWYKSERQFEFRNDTLRLKDSVSAVAEFYPMPTFKWLQRGSSFEIRLAAFYPISIDTKGIYTKVK